MPPSPGWQFGSAGRVRFCSGVIPVQVTRRLPMKMQLLALTPLALTLMGAEDAPDALSLQGTWTMDAAYEVQANGTRTTNYGEHPSGLMIVDRARRYSIQIFRRDRPPVKS